MNAFFTRKLDLKLGFMDFLGSCTAGGQAYYFLRREGTDYAIIARPHDDSGKAFKKGKTLSYEYRVFPGNEPDPVSAALLERFVASLLRSEKAIATTIREQGELAPPEQSRLELLSTSSLEETSLFRIGEEGRHVASLTVTGRDDTPCSLFHWSARIETPDDEPPRELLGRVQHFFLALVAGQMAGLPLPKGSAATAGPHKNAFVYFSLEHKDAALNTLHQMDVAEGDNVVVSIDIPSRCLNKCLFCAPQEGLPPKAALDPRNVVQQVDEILTALQPTLDKAGRTDVVLVGQDAYNSPALLPVLARLREEERLARVTIVSPGTRLSDPDFVRELKMHSLDVANLTILGPDKETHDLVAGREGAFGDLMASISNLEEAGIRWELNLVLVKQNLDQLSATVRKTAEMGNRARLYYYVAEPDTPRTQIESCTPRLTDFVAVLDKDPDLFAKHLMAIHYVPLCVLPHWARPLAGHSSQSFPDPPAAAPEPCTHCPAYLTDCHAIGRHYLELYGSEELTPLTDGE